MSLTAATAGIVAVAGGCGAALRHLTDRAATRHWGPGQVRGILAVNLLGSLLAGLLVGVMPVDSLLRVAGTALLGGFTTFSTAMLQTVTLASRSAAEAGASPVARAAGHAVLTALGCVVAAAVGLAVGQQLS